MTKTILTDDVAGSASIHHIVRPTVNVSTAGTSDVFDLADTEVFCSPNSIVKYINIRFESGLRDVAADA